MSTSDQCRAMGLKVGDTIEAETIDPETIESGRVRLTLLRIGSAVAVFSESRTCGKDQEWSDPVESASWDLSFRSWRKIDHTPDAGKEVLK